MKRPFKAGNSSSNRWTFDHHPARKRSVWSEAIARPHLIVAAVGTLALVGLAGTAIWIALPDDAPQVALLKVKEAAPAAATRAATPDLTATAAPAKAAPPQQTASAAALLAGSEAAKPSANSQTMPMLDAQNPRWVDPAAPAKAGAARDVRTIAPAPAPAARNSDDDVANAYADDDGAARDSAATAAIPNFKRPDDADEASGSGVKQAKVEGTPGRIARSVTMRSKPNVRGGVVANVPAKSQVDVISCSQWCEIVYKGKRGFIYKSFMRKD